MLSNLLKFVGFVVAAVIGGVLIDIDTRELAPGTYAVADFASVEAGDGTLEITAPLQLGSPDGRYRGTLATDGQLTLVVKR